MVVLIAELSPRVQGSGSAAGCSMALLTSGGPHGDLRGLDHDIEYGGESLGRGMHVNGLYMPTQMLHDAFISNRFGSEAF